MPAILILFKFLLFAKAVHRNAASITLHRLDVGDRTLEPVDASVYG